MKKEYAVQVVFDCALVITADSAEEAKLSAAKLAPEIAIKGAHDVTRTVQVKAEWDVGK